MGNSIRFAVGGPDYPVSGAWKLWVQGDEVYLLQRGFFSTKNKFSFHRSGSCRWAQIKAGKSGKDRLMSEWWRPKIDEIPDGAVTPIVALGFPTNHLARKIDVDHENVTWLPKAPTGQATLLQAFISKSPRQEIYAFSGPVSPSPIFTSPLRTQGFVHVTCNSYQCGVMDLKFPGTPVKPGQVFGDIHLPDDPTITDRPIHIGILLDANPTPIMWELSGHQTRTLAEITGSEFV